MPEHNEYKAFLACIDVFSRKIFCRALKSKAGPEVKRAMMSIFKQAHIYPQKLEVDQGSEFVASKPYFKHHFIYYKIKVYSFYQRILNIIINNAISYRLERIKHLLQVKSIGGRSFCLFIHKRVSCVVHRTCLSSGQNSIISFDENTFDTQLDKIFKTDGAKY